MYSIRVFKLATLLLVKVCKQHNGKRGPISPIFTGCILPVCDSTSEHDPVGRGVLGGNSPAALLAPAV